MVVIMEHNNKYETNIFEKEEFVTKNNDKLQTKTVDNGESGVEGALLEKLKAKINEKFGFKTEIVMDVVVHLFALHVIGIIWSYYFAFPVKWQTVAFAVFMFYFGGYGVSIGAHRYWSHRSFKATKFLEIMLIIMHCSAGQNSVLGWVRDHRVHHKYSDTSADPHDAGRGFFFSHIGWLMLKKRPEVIKRGREMNLDDILNDPLLQWQEKHFSKLKMFFCFILPTVIGVVLWGEGWKCAIAWQCFIRYLLTTHTQFTINSFAHTFGYRPYNKSIEPRNNWFTDLATLGDGHHNFHHAFPYDCFSSESFHFLHLSTYVIKLWEMLGIAYDLRVATPETIKAYAARMGDGSHNKYDIHGFSKKEVLDDLGNDMKVD